MLCGAGLLLRTLLVLERFEPGYRAASDTLLTIDFDVPSSRYPSRESMLQFYDAVEREVAALPGVRNVAWAATLPSGNSRSVTAPSTSLAPHPRTAAASRVPGKREPA